jgi:hypothetical protein
VWCEPAVPEQLLPLDAEGFHFAGARLTVQVDKNGWQIDGLPAGFELVREPRPAVEGIE